MFLRTPWLVPLALVVVAVLAYTAIDRARQPASQSSAQPQTLPVNNTEPSSNSVPSSPAPSSRRQQNDPQFTLIRGAFVVIGKSPDGDSVRFAPDNAALLDTLKNSRRIRAGKDGSVQLRFEAIDAPELHFGNAQQPLGVEARDALLKRMGFTRLRFDRNETATAATPARVRGAILSQAAESNGRPISYVFLERDVGKLEDGSRVALTDALLKLSMNDAMVRSGLAYYTVYSSTPPAQRAYFKSLALEARAAKLGVWRVDKTAAFTLRDEASVGENGQLILPKLFRRATSYLQAVGKGFNGSIKDWLIASRTTRQPEDDAVDVNGARRNLSDLIQVSGQTVRFDADLLELTFLEK
jgi:endonuclease YncB( thermonuclease family)